MSSENRTHLLLRGEERLTKHVPLSRIHAVKYHVTKLEMNMKKSSHLGEDLCPQKSNILLKLRLSAATTSVSSG